jgi:hypothetical protein
MKFNNEMSLAGFESFESLSIEELALIDGGFWKELGQGIGAVGGYVVGAVTEFVGGISDFAHSH